MFEKLFQKPQEEEKTHTLLGEDFEIFPTLDESDKTPPTEEEIAAVRAQQAEEDAPEEPKEEDMTDLQRKIAAIPEEKWKLYQILGGALLGIIIGVCIFVLPSIPSLSSWGFIIAVVLALLVPRALEKSFGRSIQRARTVMIIALGICLVISLALGLIINPNMFSKLGSSSAAEGHNHE